MEKNIEYDLEKMPSFADMKERDKKDNPEEYFLESIIGKIRAYRIFYDVSQRELSRKTGVTQSIISRMESGIYTPKLQTLVKLMSALDLELEIQVKPRNKKKKNKSTRDEERFPHFHKNIDRGIES